MEEHVVGILVQPHKVVGVAQVAIGVVDRAEGDRTFMTRESSSHEEVGIEHEQVRVVGRGVVVQLEAAVAGGRGSEDVLKGHHMAWHQDAILVSSGDQALSWGSCRVKSLGHLDGLGS